MKNALITTTINVPYNLTDYAKDIEQHGPEDTVIIVAGDLKTPPECGELLDKIAVDTGVKVTYLTPEAQKNWLTPEYETFLPWNCIQRRNVAILLAYHEGAEIIATIDDDNIWTQHGYFAGHGNLGEHEDLKIYNCPRNDPWFNVCGHARTQNGMNFFPRGFSFRNRKNDISEVGTTQTGGRRVVNGGLWTGDPDIDAVTRMATSLDVKYYEESDRMTLGLGTLCPFNSQNTALHRDVIPAYCLPTGLGRYDDIVASYIVKRIADHLGDYISFGEPVVRQVRNKHDLWKDLEDERIGMQLIDTLVDWLYQIPLSGSTYKECIVELIHDFKEKINCWEEGNLYTPKADFMRSIVINYEYWMKIT